MRLAIRCPNSAPSGYWSYKQPISEVSFNRQSLKWLVKDVRIHREAMIATGHAEPEFDLRADWQERLFHDMCVQAEGLIPCDEVDENGNSLRKWLGLTDVWRWFGSVQRWKSKGKPFVTPEEAERRATICKGCRKNQPVSGCSGCHGLLGEVSTFLSGMKTLKDDDLHVCTLCSCFLRAKVWLPMEVVDNEGVDFSTAPANCWQLEQTPASQELTEHV